MNSILRASRVAEAAQRDIPCSMSEPRPASTVMLLRQPRDAVEVLLVQRSSSSVFMPSVHVFPGGRVDPEDDVLPLVGGEGDRARIAHERAAAYQAAALRETFEESGVFLGEGEVDPQDRAAVQAGTLGFAALVARSGLRPDAERLRYWAWWITPEPEPRRFDTRFFVAAVEGGDEASHDQRETVASRWWSVREALLAFERGELVLAPPTWCVLMELAGYGTVDEVMAAAPHRRPPPLQPRGFLDDEGGIVVVLPGDPEHPSSWTPPGPTRLRLSEGRWQVLRR